MEVTDRLQTLADLLPQKEVAVPTEWAPGPVWTPWRREKTLPRIEPQLLSLCINLAISDLSETRPASTTAIFCKNLNSNYKGKKDGSG
jgi:hypothetical protein